MVIRKLSILVSIITITTLCSNDVKAKSVCAITTHGYGGGYGVPAEITTYGIDGDNIYEQYVYELDQADYPTGGYKGPVGIASGGGYLFVTHENYYDTIDGIQFINAHTMLDQGVLEVADSPDFAGIVYDRDNDTIYAIVRNSNALHIFSWDSDTQTLTEHNDSPVALDEIGNYGCGLALDEIENVLYVTAIQDHYETGSSNKVYCYDANDPNSGCTGIITIPDAEDDTQLNAIGIGVYNDGQGKNYLYTGAYSYPEGSHDYLVKTDVDAYRKLSAAVSTAQAHKRLVFAYHAGKVGQDRSQGG